MPFQRILCPVDFSDCSREAMRAAVELSRAIGATVALLHVVEPPRALFPPPAGLMPTAGDGESLADARRELVAWQGHATGPGAGAGSRGAIVRGGVPWHEIVSEVERGDGFDLVVMGTHGRTGLTHVLMGSVAERVVRHARCSVLVVRPPA